MIIVDGNSLMFRSAYTRGEPIMTSGVNVLPIKSFIQNLLWLGNEFDSNKIVVAWDKKLIAGTPSYRKILAAELIGEQQYKSTRTISEVTKNILKCCDIIPEFLKPLGIISMNPVALEADDIIAWLVRNTQYEKCTIISGDSDLWQLIDTKVQWYSPVRKKLLTHYNFEQEEGYPIDKCLMFKAIKGDSSDNIPGVYGMGDVKTKKYISNFKGTHEDEEIEKIIERNLKLIDLSYCLSQSPDDVSSYQRQYETQSKYQLDLNKYKELARLYEFDDLASSTILGKINKLFHTEEEAKNDLENLLAAFL